MFRFLYCWGKRPRVRSERLGKGKIFFPAGNRTPNHPSSSLISTSSKLLRTLSCYTYDIKSSVFWSR